MTRVMVVDDHAVVRAGVVRLLQEHGMTVVAEASTPEELVSLAHTVDYDVLILDVNLRGNTSLEALKTVRAAHSERQVLILSMYAEEQYALRYLKAGAAGYLTKDTVPEELILAVRRLASGGRYLTSTVAEIALFGFGETGASTHETLSDRELEVLIGIARGKRIRAIATELCLSDKTVSTYRARILRKLGAGNNADLVEYALSQNLIT